MEDDLINLTLDNHAMMDVDTTRAIKQELSEHFSFYVPGYKFMPAYKSRAWDGKIRLFNMNTSEINVGLLQKVAQFAKDRSYRINFVEHEKYGSLLNTSDIPRETVEQFIETLGIPYTPHSYQVDAIKHAIDNKRCVLISPTGSGKSLIAYVLMRWFLLHNDSKVLIIVPTTGLVEQMIGDFEDYGYPRSKCHAIYSGKDKTTKHRVVVSTWQSIYKQPRQWFAKYTHIIGDECHGFKAKSLSSIMNKSWNAAHRVGLTGTLDGTQTNELVLVGLFGPVYQVTTTKQRMDEDTLSQLDISILHLKYPDSIRKDFGKKDYASEIKFLIKHEPRNNFIANLSTTLPGNTLVLFRFVKDHGKVLFDLIEDRVADDRKVFYIHGSTAVSDRDAVRSIVEKQKDAVIVASMGTFSTGINITNLHNIVFANPVKGQIKVLQSIGRSLRKSEDGTSAHLYDIADDISYGKRKNHALRHSAARVVIYEKEQFPFTFHEVELK
jgi:superfamily II DNA or RNA helicase